MELEFFVFMFHCDICEHSELQIVLVCQWIIKSGRKMIRSL